MRLNLDLTGICGQMGLNFVSDATKRLIEAGEMDPYQEIGDWFLGDGGFGDCSLILHRPYELAVCLAGRPVAIKDPKQCYVERRMGWKAILFTMQGEYDWMAALGYDDQPGRITYAWEGVARFDPGRLAFFVDRWDDVLGVRDYLVLRAVAYAGRSCDEAALEEGPERRSLWPPRFTSIAQARERARAELYDPARDFGA